METHTEHPARTYSGVLWFAATMAALAAMIALLIYAAVARNLPAAIAASALLVVSLGVWCSMYSLEPQAAAVRTFFGAYRGTDRTPGLRIGNPLHATWRVSLRIRNFTTHTSKVNDSRGNPIEIAAVVVWKVVDTARARFNVDKFESYVHTQSEAAVRQLARSYPYDTFDNDETTTLINNTDAINADLLTELRARVGDAGVEITEARITDLAYAPEIAEAMLRRQQAAAIVAARKEIVEGAVWMVREAVKELETGDNGHEPIPLDADRKATFASNLMTVVASDTPTHPVINVGTLSR